MYLVSTIDLTDSQESPGKMEMMKTEMTKKTLWTGLTNFMDSYIRLMSSIFVPTSDSLPFLSPIFQLLPR
jgi:hypothetical protein